MLCTYFNKRVLDFTGRTLDRTLGEGWLEMIHQDDVQRCVDAYSAGYEKQEPFVLEFRIRRADGEFIGSTIPGLLDLVRTVSCWGT